MALSKRFKISHHDNAIKDLDDAVNYYHLKQSGLGKRFYLAYKKMLKTIKRNPHYRIFYDDVHCLQVDAFPYLVHFTIDIPKRIVTVYAIICTHKNPDDAYLNKP